MARKSKRSEDGPFTSSAAAKTLAGRWGESAKRSQGLRADWHAVSPVIIQALVGTVGELGGAVTLGVDKSGSGFTVAVWVSGEKVLNQWYRGDENGLGALEQELEDFTLDVKSLLQQQ